MKTLGGLLVAVSLMLISSGTYSQGNAGEQSELGQSICFPDVPRIEHCLEPIFEDTWQRAPVGGEGLTREQSILYYGLPLSEGRHELNADADCVFTQWFERAAFESHPKNPPKYAVLLRRLGAEIQGRTTVTVPNPCD